MESNRKKVCNYPCMEQKNNMAVVQKISTEINDVRNKAFTSKRCYKAQISSHKNLLKEQKTANMEYKLQSEAINNSKESINNSIANFNRLLSIENTCMMANNTSMYNLTFAKQMSMTIRKRMETSMKIYNERWLRSNEKIESLPMVRLLLQKQSIKKDLLNNLHLCKKRIISLKKSITSKRSIMDKSDEEKIIKFAQFMIYERPKMLDLIKITKRKIAEQIVIIDKLKEKNVSHLFVYDNKQFTSDNDSEMQENRSKDFKLSTTPISTKKYNDQYSKLLLSISEVDVEPQVKTDLVQNPFINIATFGKLETNRYTENEFSSYFAFRYFLDAKQDNDPSDVPNEKQIHLIDNKNVNEKEAQSILFSVNPKALKSVTSIGFDSKKTTVPIDEPASCQQMETETMSIPMELNEIIEPVNQQFITPPTQFIDQIQNEENISQLEKITDDDARSSANVNLKGKLKKSENRKRVAFNIPEEHEADDVSQENFISPKSDTSGNVMRTDHFKKYKLDTSPQFTYAKNNLRKRTNDEDIKSKFFSDFGLPCKENVEEGKEYEKEVNEHNIVNDLNEKKDEPMNVHNEMDQSQASEIFSARQLPSYRKDFPASFDATFNTTATEDDLDYQPCIDANLLLSPKSDVPEDNEMQNSEQISSFLSGIKMKGLSFFANAGGKSDQNVQNEDDFKFNFGKSKNKGGFFDIFH